MSSGGPARPSPSQDLDRQGKQWANAMWMLGKWPKRENMRAGPSDHQMGPCGAGGGCCQSGHQPLLEDISLTPSQKVWELSREWQNSCVKRRAHPAHCSPHQHPQAGHGPPVASTGDGGGGWATGIGLKVKCEQAPQRRGALKAP